MNRRDFLKNSASVVATAAIATVSTETAFAQPSPPSQGEAKCRISSQEAPMPGRNYKEKVENLIAYGGDALELYAKNLNVAEALEAIKGTPIVISAICAADGPYIVPDKTQQRKAVDNAKMLLEKAGELKSTGVIMVPAFNWAKDQLEGREAYKLLIDLLHELGEHGVKNNSRMVMEPLNRGEAFYMRQIAFGASICQDVNSPGVCMMGDMYHMNFEETSDQAGFMSGGPWLHHVHLASGKRNLPGQDKRSFVDGFRGLKRIGFHDFMSLECHPLGKAEEEVPKSFKFLRDQWEQATV
jgi:sugar phosphate isomerase/epimerase